MGLYQNRIVVKVGTSTLTNEIGKSDLRTLDRLACILSDINGFYDSDPRLHPDAKLIERIEKIDESVYSLAGGAGSRRGTGGMKTKLQAAGLDTSNGIDVIVTNGKKLDSLYETMQGNQVGTIFVGKVSQ